MNSVFSIMTPTRSLTKYKVDLLEVIDAEAKMDELSTDGKMAGGSSTLPGRGDQHG